MSKEMNKAYCAAEKEIGISWDRLIKLALAKQQTQKVKGNK
jgi:hypothetical protein